MSAVRCRTAARVIAWAFACVLLAGGARAAEPAPVTRARWLMGTLFTASAPAASPADSARVGAALDAALDTVAALERTLSNWNAASELSRLNDAGASAALSEPLRAVLDSALVWAAATQGAFDPTIEPLVRAYDLRGAGRVPDAATLNAARARVGYTRIVRSGDTVQLNGAQLDLGGIAKGFALDRAAALLAARNVRDAVLDAGGQRFGSGPAQAWLADPRDRDRAAVRVQLPAGSLSTSTQRERALVVRGRRVGHVLDPRTGEPVPGEASVSVAAASGTRADALSTALLVLGRARAQAYAAAHPELGVLWLEPGKHGLDAYAWNLTIDSAASHVRIVTRDTVSQLSH
jgi:thiamine biosynthesis lipoprotein